MIKGQDKFLSPKMFSLQPDLNKLPDREIVFEPNDFKMTRRKISSKKLKVCHTGQMLGED